MNVHDPVAVAPALNDTDAHDTVSPMDGVITVVNETVPAKPQVVVHSERTPVPPKLESERLEAPELPVVTDTGELALKVKSLMRAVLVGAAWFNVPLR